MCLAWEPKELMSKHNNEEVWCLFGNGILQLTFVLIVFGNDVRRFDIWHDATNG